MKRTTLTFIVCLAAITGVKAQTKYLGGDISMLPVYEQNNVSYKDKDGVKQTDVIQFFGNNGWNAERVRLFVDPYSGVTHDATGCYQTLYYVKELGKRIKEHGQAFMLDFHYSDTWTDPGKHSLPKSWEGLSVEQLKTKIYDYTKDCLAQLKAYGATPDFIQTGNEITTGMMWPTGGIFGHGDNSWPNFTAYLEQAILACNEECPKAKIVIHIELHNYNSAKAFFNTLRNTYPNVKFDIIGLSYYPEHHGTVISFGNLLNDIETANPGKDIMIVETGHGSKWHIPGGGDTNYALTEAGQKQFTQELVTLLNKHPRVTGLFWWYPEDNGNNVKYNGEKIDWWNASLYNHSTGKPLAAFYELTNFRPDFVAGISEITETQGLKNGKTYNLAGQRVGDDYKGIVIKNGKKIVK